MTIETHRTVEHTYSDGNQSILKVQTIEFDKPIDETRVSIMIHSRDQLNRLIANLQWVADNVASGIDEKWEK